MHKTARFPTAKAGNNALIFTPVCLFRAESYMCTWIYIHKKEKQHITELQLSDKAYTHAEMYLSHFEGGARLSCRIWSLPFLTANEW